MATAGGGASVSLLDELTAAQNQSETGSGPGDRAVAPCALYAILTSSHHLFKPAIIQEKIWITNSWAMVVKMCHAYTTATGISGYHKLPSLEVNSCLLNGSLKDQYRTLYKKDLSMTNVVVFPDAASRAIVSLLDGDYDRAVAGISDTLGPMAPAQPMFGAYYLSVTDYL